MALFVQLEYLWVVLICYAVMKGSHGDEELRLKVLTVVTDKNDGCRRFIRSANTFNLDVDAIELDEDWIASEKESERGGYIMDELRRRLEKYKDEKNLILLFVGSCEDSLFTTGEQEIVEKFKNFETDALMAARETCRPNRMLAGAYPVYEGAGYNFVSSGGIMGFAPFVYEIIASHGSTQTDNLQLYLTHIYLGNPRKYKGKYVIKLDRFAEVFQVLNKGDEVEFQFEGSFVNLINTAFKTYPCVLHSEEQSRIHLNHLSNYVPTGWSYDDGCVACKEDQIDLGGRKGWPTILIGLFVTAPTPFLDSFLMHISNFDYPKNKISVFLYNAEGYHITECETWLRKFDGYYKSLVYEGPDSFLSEDQARNRALAQGRREKCDFYFSVDSIATLPNRDTLRLLIESNKPFLAPMLSKTKTHFSNFWGAVGKDGYYARSPDYLQIVKNEKRGVWNVPFVNSAYLLSLRTIEKLGANPFYTNRENEDELEIEFCANTREKGIFMYVTNMEHFGHLKEMKKFSMKHKHNDMYQVIDNRVDWEEKYLHPEYRHYLQSSTPQIQPCHDVYWVPMFTKNFTTALIEECEHNGNWSDGGHNDARLGFYENVPTVDIHMTQIGFENNWLYLLQEYFAPMALRVFAGYYSKSSAYMNFVVKYSPSGQYFLRPHNDESTYTVNLALNEPGVDYEGGGARFIRYNCSVRDTKAGWALLHPGRLTHHHEGLPTTKGTRYIMISFVDP